MAAVRTRAAARCNAVNTVKLFIRVLSIEKK